MSTHCLGAGRSAELDPTAWTDLERSIARALRRLRKDQYLVLDYPGQHRFVQFVADGAGALRAEATSDVTAYEPRGRGFDPCQPRQK